MTKVSDAELLSEMQGYINDAPLSRGISEPKDRFLDRVARFLGVDEKRLHSYHYNKVKKVRAIDLINAQLSLMSTQARTKEIEAEIERLRGFDAKLDSSIHVRNTQLDCKEE